MKYLSIFGLPNVFNWKKSDCWRNHSSSKAHTALQCIQSHYKSLKSSFSFQQMAIVCLYLWQANFKENILFHHRRKNKRKIDFCFAFYCTQLKAQSQALGLMGIKHICFRLGWRHPESCWNCLAWRVTGERTLVHALTTWYLLTQKRDALKWARPSENVHRNSSKHTSPSFLSFGVTLHFQRPCLNHQGQAMEKSWHFPKLNA